MKGKFAAYYPGLLLFIVFLLLGIATYKDYGISWDEPIQHRLGLLTYNHIFNGDTTILTDQDRALGTAFELPLIFIEKIFNLTDSRDIYFARHLATHIFFLISVFCGYVLAMRLFKAQRLAILAFLMLALQPRIYAHSFFNSKDLPFLSAFLISMLCFHVAFEKRKLLLFVLLGVATAYATAIRLVGVLWLGAVFLFLLHELISHKQNIKTLLQQGAAYLASFIAALYAFWPYLWDAPFSKIAEGYSNLSHLASGGKILFNGEILPANPLPALYMPEWFCITMPEVWLLTGFTGILLVVINNIRKATPVTPGVNKYMILYLCCFIIPPAILILTHAAIIDDWRHLYFIYPAFVMLAVYAIYHLRRPAFVSIIMAVQGIQIAVVCYDFLMFCPQQQVYFNYLVSHKKETLRKQFDMDYWGCAYLVGLEYILTYDGRPVIKVYGESQLVDNAKLMLSPSQRKRIIHVWKDEQPDYFITNFRGTIQDYNYPIYYKISRMNSTIMAVYKMQ